MCREKVSLPERLGVKSAAAIMHEHFWGQKVLLVGGSESKQTLRASILRAHGLQVDVAPGLADSRSLWQRKTYHWVLLDVGSQLPGQVIDFCEQLRHAAPGQRIAFFVGPPTYVSLKWPGEAMTEYSGKERRATELKAAA
jgi:CheY-like chemotaxis protein